MKVSQEVFDSIFDTEFKLKIVNRINKSVNIPLFLSEKKEAVIIGHLYEIVKNTIEEVIIKE